MNTTETNSASEKPKSSLLGKIIVLTIFGSIAAFLYWQFGSQLSLESLAQRETALRSFQADHPVLVFAIAFAIYVAVTGMSLPGASALSLMYGWYFGFIEAFVLVSFASTLGATIAFLLCRYLFRDAMMNRFGERLTKFNEALEREGPFYLFTLRLIPAVPFFIVNAVMGLTPIKTRTFWWVSQLGMLAGTAVFIYAGSSVPNLSTLADKGVNAAFSSTQMMQIIGAFAMIGLLPLITRWMVKTFRKNPGAESPAV
jgi:uncharacterized membrane protein YdjX (TVP38/TMEM64 family)